MPIEVLVATPHAPLGKLIRQVLDQNGAYAAGVYGSAAEAVAGCQNKHYEIAILDWDLPDRPIASLGPELKQIQPGLKLVIFPPDNNLRSPLLAGFTPDAYLNKPFYLPDLLAIMTRLLAGEAIPPPPVTAPSPPTARSLPEMHSEQPAPSQGAPEQIVQTLQRFLNSSGAIASLIFNSGAVWAFAGNLPEGSIRHLTELITGQWSPQAQGDLIRFINLTPENSSYLLFATRLSSDLVLSVLYPSSTPFSRVRTQANRLGHSLSGIILGPGADDLPISGATLGSAPGLEPAPVAPAPSSSPAAAASQPASQSSWTQGQVTAVSEEDEADEAPIESLPPLFEDIPAPQPARTNCMTNGWVPEIHPTDPSEVIAAPVMPPENRFQGEDPIAPATFGSSSPARPKADVLDGVEVSLKGSDPAIKEKPKGHRLFGKIGFGIRRVITSPQESPPAQPAPPEPLASAQSLETVPDNRPLVVRVPKPQAMLEPANTGIASLTYTCVLVPRLPQHFLTGEIGDSLGKWLPQLCLAFGWNLEGLAIRPSHMEWVVRLPPMVAPGKMLRIIRQRISQHIFTAFPHLQEDNPSGDFWSPGYLIVSGTRSLPTELLQEYVNQTRQRQ